jgi:hypothetical protein
MVGGIIFLFVALALSVTSHPFDPRPLLNGFIIVFFLILRFLLVNRLSDVSHQPVEGARKESVAPRTVLAGTGMR